MISNIKNLIGNNKKVLTLLTISTTLTILVFIVIWLRNRMIPPVDGKITSKFGTRTHPITGEAGSDHNGIDIAASSGTEVVSPAKGIVKNTYYNNLGGHQVIIEHENNYVSGFAHLQPTSVKIGQKLKRGDSFAKVGSSGSSTGPHLHFTLKDPSGNFIDPETKINFKS